MNPEIRQYIVVTTNYCLFTLTDGALRMLVVLHFYHLGYSPLDIALLFIFYEIFGVVTNLAGGWLGAKTGLNATMNLGVVLQLVALSLLLVPTSALSVPWVMTAQALSGIAKDLNKMSAKSAIKLVIPDNKSTRLYQWVAWVTGSKNALKGVGFFTGGALLAAIGFQGTILVLIALILCLLLSSQVFLTAELGKATAKPSLRQVFSSNSAINYLAAARLFLFGARDVWFVVALPVYLAVEFQWSHWQVGGFMAFWVIGYGIIQSMAPGITASRKLSFTSDTLSRAGNTDRVSVPDGRMAIRWVALLAGLPGLIAVALLEQFYPLISLLFGLMVFGAVFAVNSSIHSFLIVDYAREDGVSLDVGFYYMANAMGRLLGTVLSGWVFQEVGLVGCLFVSLFFLLIATGISILLPRHA